MGKSFFEVFPTLQMEGEMQSLLSEVEVTKVATNRNRDLLYVYLLSNHLIPKKKIYVMEKEIKKQLFPTKAMTIKIAEKFALSSQYTPKNLMDVYKDSILLEIKNYSLLLYNLFYHLLHIYMKIITYFYLSKNIHLHLSQPLFF